MGNTLNIIQTNLHIMGAKVDRVSSVGKVSVRSISTLHPAATAMANISRKFPSSSELQEANKIHACRIQ